MSNDVRMKMSQNLLSVCCKNFGKTGFDDDDDDECDHDKEAKKPVPPVIFKEPKVAEINLDGYLDQLNQLSQC